MDDRKLEVLLATVRTGSFSKAAEITNRTQSAVTQIMNSLEDELGCRILERSHKGVTLTPAGEMLLPNIIEADTAISNLMKRAQSISEGKELPIRIGTFSSIVNTWLPELMKEYKELHPETAFHLEIGTSLLSQWLINDLIDVAFGDAERCKGFRFYELMDDPYMAAIPVDIAPPGDTISQNEFASYPFVMAPANALKIYLEQVPENSINVVTDDDATLYSIVSQGLGATAIPKLSLQNLPASDKVKIMELVPHTNRKLGIAVGSNPDRRITNFVSFVRKKMGDI